MGEDEGRRGKVKEDEGRRGDVAETSQQVAPLYGYDADQDSLCFIVGYINCVTDLFEDKY